jgi:1,4-alpha-glucan branching enzyme
MSALDFAPPKAQATARPVVVPPPGVDSATIDALVHGRLGDPFAVLGPHRVPTDEGPCWMVRTFQPGPVACS